MRPNSLACWNSQVRYYKPAVFLSVHTMSTSLFVATRSSDRIENCSVRPRSPAFNGSGQKTAVCMGWVFGNLIFCSTWAENFCFAHDSNFVRWSFRTTIDKICGISKFLSHQFSGILAYESMLLCKEEVICFNPGQFPSAVVRWCEWICDLQPMTAQVCCRIEELSSHSLKD